MVGVVGVLILIARQNGGQQPTFIHTNQHLRVEQHANLISSVNMTPGKVNHPYEVIDAISCRFGLQMFDTVLGR
jgi:hypothetical protein